jgi:hypothetical protein
MPNRDLERGNERWTVREVDARRVPGARADRCLICESGEVVRRLWEYPKNWTELDDEALWKLCDELRR